MQCVESVCVCVKRSERSGAGGKHPSQHEHLRSRREHACDAAWRSRGCFWDIPSSAALRVQTGCTGDTRYTHLHVLSANSVQNPSQIVCEIGVCPKACWKECKTLMANIAHNTLDYKRALKKNYKHGVSMCLLN